MMKIESLKFVGIISLILLISGCDLPLQEEFDFKPEVDTPNPYENLTALEWLELSTTPELADNGRYNPLEFNYFIAAIKKAGMEEEYTQTNNKERTYIALQNRAFYNNSGALREITGSAALPPNQSADDYMEQNIDTPEKLEKLKRLIQYHIVTSYVLQTDLTVRDTDYLFQTLLPGEDGIIALRRDVILQIRSNHPEAPLSETALTGFGFYHNFQLNNGIAHVFRTYTRNRPY